jgi:hypothetical protein
VGSLSYCFRYGEFTTHEFASASSVWTDEVIVSPDPSSDRIWSYAPSEGLHYAPLTTSAAARCAQFSSVVETPSLSHPVRGWYAPRHLLA